MTNITLDPYIVRIRKRRDKQGLKLGSFNGSESFPSYVSKCLQSIKKKKSYKIESLSKAVVIENLEEDGDHIRGTLKSGLFGFAGSIIDSETGDENYKKKKTDADLIPVYFDFYLPENSYKGILILQTFGTYGIKQIIEHIIVDLFRQQYLDYMLDIKHLVPSKAVKDYLSKAKVNKVRFIKHSIPSDYADRFNKNAGDREGEIEISIKPKDKGLFARMKKFVDFFEGESDINDVYEFDDFEYDNIKLEIEIGDQKRTLDFLNPERLKASVNVTTNIEKGADGYPKYSALKEESKALIKSFAKDMGITPK